MNISWRKNGYHFKADPEKVYQELQTMGDAITPADIVDYARNEATALHDCFTWDDGKAAENWRLQEARTVVHNLIIVNNDEEDEDAEPVRVYFSISSEDENRTYQPTSVIVRDQEKYEALREEAWRELRRIKAKYSMITELKEIFALIA